MRFLLAVGLALRDLRYVGEIDNEQPLPADVPEYVPQSIADLGATETVAKKGCIALLARIQAALAELHGETTGYVQRFGCPSHSHKR